MLRNYELGIMSYDCKTGMGLESLKGAGSLVWKRMMPAPFVLEKC